MKNHIKLFEEFVNEYSLKEGIEDEINASINKEKKNQDEKKKKNDPFQKEKLAAKKKKEKAEKKLKKEISTTKNNIEDLLADHPEIDKKLGDKIIDAINSKDRVKIHNAFNDLMALQIKYQENGDTSKVNQIAKLKDEIDDLDKSYTDDKMI